MQILHTNKLLLCCHPFLMSISPFIHDSQDNLTTALFHEQLLKEFAELDRKARLLQMDEFLINQVKYVMAALIDEIVLNSSWPGRTEWMGKPLQMQLFGEHLAGEGFFARLDTLRRSITPNVDLLEVYYVCLQFGFSGKYHILSQEYLLSLKEGLFQQIATLRDNIVTPLMLENNVATQKTSAIYREIPLWMMGITTAVLIIGIYLCTDIMSHNRTDYVLQQIRHYRDMVTLV